MNTFQALHNKYAKLFKDNIVDLEFKEIEAQAQVNPNAKNIIEEKKDHSQEIDTLRSLCLDVFEDNKKLYKRNRRVRRLKVFLCYDLPIFGLLVASGFALSTPRKSEVIPVYHVEQTMISDDKVITDIDETNYYMPTYGQVLSDEDFVKIDNTNTKIQFQIKNGTNNQIVSINVGSDGALKVANYLAGNFYDLNAAAFKGVEPSEIEEKYQEIINDIRDFIANTTTGLTEKQKSDIEEFLKEEKTMVITTFIEYFQAFDVEVMESDSEYNKRLAKREGLCFLGYAVAMIIIAACGGAKVKQIEVHSGTKLKLDNVSSWIIPFKTAAEAKDALIYAERERRAKIEDFAYNNLEGEAKKKFLS